MFPTKAFGPDGFHALFYQKYWDFFRIEVVEMVLGFLNGAEEIMGINGTFFCSNSKDEEVKKTKYWLISLLM